MEIKNCFLIIVCLIILSATVSGIAAGDVNDTLISSDDNDLNEVLTVEPSKTFKDLNTDINSNENSEINLKCDYAYNSTVDSSYKNGVKITRDVTINGNSHILDGSNLARIFTVENANVVFKNVKFINGYASKYGGAIYGDATVDSCEFTNNTATYSGGAIYGNCTVINSNFIDNKASRFYGGAVYGKTTLTDCDFENNFARLYGGAVYGGKAIDSTFTKNKVNQKGGAICDGKAQNCHFKANSANTGGAVENCNVVNSNFENNTAGDGGAAYNSTVISCIFKANTATQRGGAVYATQAKGSQFIKNTAKAKGGAACLGDYLECIFKDNIVTNHKGELAQYGGGAIYNATASYCSFENNTGQWGGAILISAKVENCNFTANSVSGWAENHPGYGGAIFEANAKNCNFIKNTADGYGGAIYCGKAVNCNFDANHGYCGGAIFNSDKIQNCNFTNNYVESSDPWATGNGGAIFNASAEGCTFINNSADGRGGAIWNGSATNCNFISNKAAWVGGAIFEGNAHSSNFTQNHADQGGAIFAGVATDCILSKNHASLAGAVFGNVTNCILKDNSAKLYSSGAVYGHAFDSTFENNHANTFGGAIEGTGENCIFINNSANYGGAMSPIKDGDYALNCEFINNSANENGGALYNINAEDCKFSKNKANGKGGAIYGGNASNSIFIENTADQGGAIFGINNTASGCEFIKNTANTDSTTANVNTTNCNISDDTRTAINVTLPQIKDKEGDIAINLPKDAAGKIALAINNENYEFTAKDGICNIKLPDLTNGYYKYTIAYIGDEKYYSSPYTSTICISLDEKNPLITPDIAIPQLAENTEEITISIPDDALGTLTLTVNGKDYPFNIKNGIANVKVPELPNGEYPYTIAYSGDSKYTPLAESGCLKINRSTSEDKTKPEISIPKLDIRGGNITLPSDATGTVTLTINNKDYVFEVKNGISSVKMPELPDGEYTYTIKYSGDSKYDPATQTGSVKINNKTSIKIPEFNNGNGKIELPEDATGTVTVTINNKDYTFEVKNGVCDIQLPELQNGEYTYTIKYSGDSKYPPITTTANLTVKKQDIAPIITAKNVKVIYKAASYYKIVVNGTDGKFAKEAVIAITVNSKIFKTLETNENGTAKFKITQKPGTYNLVITSLNTTVTKKLTVKHLVSLKKVKVKRSAKKLILQANLAKINGKYIKGKKVTFKFNGKTYKAKTNSKGIAKYTIKSKVLKKLKAGKKITYQATYGKDTVKRTVKVLK